MHWRNASKNMEKKSYRPNREFDNDSWYMHRKPSKQTKHTIVNYKKNKTVQEEKHNYD